jgi:hypothetical protein
MPILVCRTDLKQNQGPKVLDSSLARGPLQCQSEHYNKWKTSPRCRSVAVAAQLAPSVAAAPLAGACRCPSQAPPGNRNPGRAYGFCTGKLTLAIHMGPVLLAAAVKNVRHATAPTLRATEPAPSPGVRVDLQGRQAGASS